MDEAERCHRIAILDRGVLVADGTPHDLTGELAGRTLLVAAADPRRAQRALLGVDGVLSVAQIGNTLRVLTDGEGEAEARARQALADAHLQADIEPVEPNLEDVFVSATRGRTASQEQAA